MTPLSPRQRISAGAMALSFHVLFIAALVISVSWRHEPEAPVFADLWTSLPAPPPPAPRPEPVAPPPRPEPKVEAKPIPKPENKVSAKANIREADVKQSDRSHIALKAQEEKKRLQEKQRLEEERKKAEAKKAEEEAERKQEEARKKAEAEKKAREEKEQALKKALAQQMEAEIARESAEIAQMQASASRGKLVDDYRAKIIQKVRGYVRLPANLTGNPEVVFQVTLLPNGEVQGVSMARSSGQPLYDQEVERAILKASPLPLPPDPSAAAAFRAGLVLKFRPHER